MTPGLLGEGEARVSFRLVEFARLFVNHRNDYDDDDDDDDDHDDDDAPPPPLTMAGPARSSSCLAQQAARR